MTNQLIIKKIGRKGRGIVSPQQIEKNEIVEICPVIILRKQDIPKISETVLFNYYFGWGQEGEGAIALGYGSLYNHSENPNIEAVRDFKNKTITMTSLRKIKPGQELTISYGATWFNVA